MPIEKSTRFDSGSRCCTRCTLLPSPPLLSPCSSSDAACAVIRACRTHIETRLIGGDEPPGQPAMETLADALTGVDYYLESMEEQKPIGEGVLDVSEQAMAELGYALAEQDTHG